MQLAIVAIVIFIAAFAGTYLANYLSRPCNTCYVENPDQGSVRTHEILAEFKSTDDEDEAYVAKQTHTPSVQFVFNENDNGEDEEDEKKEEKEQETTKVEEVEKEEDAEEEEEEFEELDA